MQRKNLSFPIIIIYRFKRSFPYSLWKNYFFFFSIHKIKWHDAGLRMKNENATHHNLKCGLLEHSANYRKKILTGSRWSMSSMKKFSEIKKQLPLYCLDDIAFQKHCIVNCDDMNCRKSEKGTNWGSEPCSISPKLHL